MGRITEFFDYIHRKDLSLGRNPKNHEYVYLVINMKIKRARYLYQMELRGKKPVV